jgi:cyclic pyranopterin phosphate synthase
MPFDEYVWIARQEILTFEEIERLARIFIGLGVERIRLTGGEPLLRKDLHRLVERLAALGGLQDLCLTTNGALLAEQAPLLKAAGLRRINVSLDTLDPEKFKRIVKRGNLARVLEGLFAAQSQGLHPIKINAVIERGVNDDEILDLVAFAREHAFALRFIEFMDVGNANGWQSDKIVTKQEILQTIQRRFPLREIGRDKGSAPSVDYACVDGDGDIGVIASVSEPFCGSCTRARLTADGKFVTCLFSNTGYNLKALLRDGASDDDILAVLGRSWGTRRDRYSEERLAALRSAAGYDPKEHKKIEMISLGG